MNNFNIQVQGDSSVRLPTAGKYCDRDILIIAEQNWNDFFNKWGADSYETLDTLIYRQNKIAAPYKFCGIKSNKLFITEAKVVPFEAFAGGEFELLWFGSLNLNSSPQGKLELKGGSFYNNGDLQHMVVNFDGSPLEVLSLEQDNVFASTPIGFNEGCIYVPANRVSQWQEAINNYEITNLAFWAEVKPISSLFEEGGLLYDTVLPSE